MSNIILSDKHIPCGYMGILGCNGYEVSDKIRAELSEAQ